MDNGAKARKISGGHGAAGRVYQPRQDQRHGSMGGRGAGLVVLGTMPPSSNVHGAAQSSVTFDRRYLQGRRGANYPDRGKPGRTRALSRTLERGRISPARAAHGAAGMACIFCKRASLRAPGRFSDARRSGVNAHQRGQDVEASGIAHAG